MGGLVHQGPFMPGDPLMAVGTSMLQQSGKTYFESGRRYVASWGSVVSGGLLHYHFDINTEYGETACLLYARGTAYTMHACAGDSQADYVLARCWGARVLLKSS